MELLALSVNHTTAPLALRERVAFPAGRLHDALADLHGRLAGLVPESAILSTCNRTELYCAVSEPDAAQGALVDWLAHGSVLSRENLRPHLYALPQRSAVEHAFRVASGVDSMVPGEPQILDQMKDAARYAHEAGALGTHLHELFERSFAVAKEVRSRNEIGSAAVSMVAAAVRLAGRLFGDLRETRVLFVGAGEMIEHAATHFAAQRPRAMVVANRTLKRAECLARRLGAGAMQVAELPGRLAHFDIVVSGTASPLPIIGLDMVERACRARGGRPLLMVDLAVPRDIDPEVRYLQDVFLYTVDDLGGIVQSGYSSRRGAAARAEAIIETRVESFMRWMAARRAVPLLRTLEERAWKLRAVELKRARRLLARGEPVETVLAALATGLSNKFLHGPRSLLACGALAQHEAQEVVEQWLAGPDRRAGSQSAQLPAQARASTGRFEEAAIGGVGT